MAPVVIIIGAVIVLLLIGGWVIGLAFKLLWFVLIGILIGALARLILPGRQAISWLWTAGAGIAGSLLGAILADLFDAGGHRAVPGRDRVGGDSDRALQRIAYLADPSGARALPSAARSLLLGLAYWTVCELWWMTIGKRIFSIRVASADGEGMTWRQTPTAPRGRVPVLHSVPGRRHRREDELGDAAGRPGDRDVRRRARLAAEVWIGEAPGTPNEDGPRPKEVRL